MTAKVLEGFSGKLSEQWAATLLTPAFAFWAGGCAAYLSRPLAWNNFLFDYNQYPESLCIAALVLAFCTIAASAFILQRFDIEIIRLLCGYWYPPFRFLLKPLRARHIRRQKRLDQQWHKLPRHSDQFAHCDRALHHYPDRPEDIRPFSLGNILCAAERRPRDRYGLDLNVCWPRLWLLLPDTTKKDLTDAYTDLTNSTRLWLWSILFLLWTVFAWWAAPIAASFAYSRSQDAASSYADLLESAFDLHRFSLYQTLRFPLPNHPAEEKALGEQLTEYLWRGSDLSQPTFLPPPSKS